MRYLPLIFLLGCAAAVQHQDFDAGGRQCRFTKAYGVVALSCDPGDAEVFPPVASPNDGDGTMIGVFQDILDLKIFQPTLVEGISVF